MTTIAILSGNTDEDAARLCWADFEGAVVVVVARRSRCDVIVTRNPLDFKRSPVRVLSPSEAVAWIEATA